MNYNDAKKYVRSFSTVRYVEERPFTIAVVELLGVSSEEVVRSGKPQRLMVAKGLSTCSPTDKWNTERGQDIARGRAEAKLARRVMRMAAKKAAKRTEKSWTLTINSNTPSPVIIDGEEGYCL